MKTEALITEDTELSDADARAVLGPLPAGAPKTSEAVVTSAEPGESVEITSGEAPETETSAMERHLFSGSEKEVGKSMTEEHVEATKISEKSINDIEGFLAEDSQAVYREFALQWFEKNKDAVAAEGIVIPPNPTDKWKAHIVLASPENQGMGAIADINNEEYQEVREKRDAIEILRAGLKKEVTPQAVPFLLVKHLWTRYEQYKKELDELDSRGDEVSRVLADGKEKEVDRLLEIMEEISGKGAHENIAETANIKVAESGFGPGDKKGWVDGKVEKRQAEIEEERREELIKREWERFRSDPKREKKMKMQDGSGWDITLEVPFEDFCKSRADERRKMPEEAFENYYNQESYRLFRGGIKQLAEGVGIKDEAFYGLLELAYKPYEAKVKRNWLFRKNKVVIPRNFIPSKEVLIGENNIIENGKVDISNSKFIAGVRDGHNEKMKKEAEKDRHVCEASWNKERERRIIEEKEKRIAELTLSLETAVINTKERYKQAKAEMLEEFVASHMTKEPSDATPEWQVEINKIFGNRQESGKAKKGGKSETIKTPGEILGAIIVDFAKKENHLEGGLSDIKGEFDEDVKTLSEYFIRTLGVKEMTQSMLRGIINDYEGKQKYRESCKTIDRLTGWFLTIMEDAPWEKKLKKLREPKRKSKKVKKTK